MSSDVIVQKYSQALFDVVVTTKSGVLAFEMATVAKIFSEASAVDFFSSPFNTQDTKVMAAKSALEGRCLPETFNFIVTLVENERIGLVQQINEQFQFLIRAQSGETEGVLFASAEPSDAFKTQVEQELTKALKKKVKLGFQKDASLLSGYKVTVGSLTIDDSSQFHLNKLKEDISKRGL